MSTGQSALLQSTQTRRDSAPQATPQAAPQTQSAARGRQRTIVRPKSRRQSVPQPPANEDALDQLRLAATSTSVDAPKQPRALESASLEVYAPHQKELRALYSQLGSHNLSWLTTNTHLLLAEGNLARALITPDDREEINKIKASPDMPLPINHPRPNVAAWIEVQVLKAKQTNHYDEVKALTATIRAMEARVPAPPMGLGAGRTQPAPTFFG